MTNEDPSSKPNRDIGQQVNDTSIIKVTTKVYGGMFIAGLALMHFWQNNLTQSFTWPADQENRFRVVAGGILAAAFLLTSSAAMQSTVNSFKNLQRLFRDLVGPIPYWAGLWLAVTSSAAEEVLFRGALQPTLGLIPTSILFGLAHVGPDGKIGAWSLWAALAGVILGWTYSETGYLWSAIIAHFLVNGISIFLMQRQFRNQ